MILWRHLVADIQKVKHTAFLWAHLIAPLVGSGLFLAYISGRASKPLNTYSNFLEAIGVILPLVISILCGIVASQEEKAGKFQVLLGSSIRRETNYISKLLFLMLGNIFAILLAVLTFVLGMKYILHIPNIPYLVFFQGAGWLIGSSVILYIIYLWVSFTFGLGASSLLGGLGLLVSALMITGLGDGIWKYIPWAWGVRFTDTIGVLQLGDFNSNIKSAVRAEFEQGQIIFILLTIILFVVSIVWFRKWEGKKFYE